MSNCLICLEPLEQQDVHPECSLQLYGTPEPPTIDLTLASMHTAALLMIGHTSISGMQRKISVKLSDDRLALHVATEAGQYILKPDTKSFPEVPANEHVTMLIARAAKLEIPPCGLVRLADDSIAYIISRFDRTEDGKLKVEDFCQLDELPPVAMFSGSSEACVRIVRRFATEPLLENLKLYRQFVFAYWIGNGDMHRKNLSLLTTADGIHVLSPAYDLLCTRLVMPQDQLALPIDGKKDRLKPETWRNFAHYCGIPARAASRVINEVVETRDQAASLINKSFLSSEMRERYIALIDKRTAQLTE